MPLLISIAAFLTGTLLAYAVFSSRGAAARERLRAFGIETSGRSSYLAAPFSERVLFPLLARLGRMFAGFTPDRLRAEAAVKLEMAGNPMSIATFLAMRGACLVLPITIAGIMVLANPPRDFGGMFSTVVVFWTFIQLPKLWLNRKVEGRQKAIQRALPDALDLITVSMEAGLAFDAAVAKVIEKTKGPLRDEFARVLQDMAFGKLRREAFRDLGKRTGVPDLVSFTAAIVQADQMGIGLAQVLRTQADEMRVRRRQRAEETAMKAPVKMLFPLILCIFPAMMIVTLGPAVMAIYTNVIVRFQGLR